MGVEVAADFGRSAETALLRGLALTPASTIKPRRVQWLWKDRVAYGTLALLAGREGVGKSTLGYKIAAEVTRGTLEGEDQGNPRAVLVCASEDSWEHTIVPRLIAAQADLDQIYRVEMMRTLDGLRMSLSLPRDVAEVRDAASETGAKLLILDPLMSVIDATLDTHRDREVRQALEPLASLAYDASMAIIGLIHHNKSGSTDALQLVMGSKAFAAVARSVHTCIPDPDNPRRRLFATSKNNLGRTDLPVLAFTITSHPVETEDEGTAWTGRLEWTGVVEGSLDEIMSRGVDPERGATAEAARWLQDYLASHGGELPKVDIEKAARDAGHAQRTVQRARERLGIKVAAFGFPRRTHWALPETQLGELEDPTQPVQSQNVDSPGLPNLSAATLSRASSASEVSSPASRDKSRQGSARLGPPAPDLVKHRNQASGPASGHAGGDENLAQLNVLAQLNPSRQQGGPVAPSSPVVPSVQAGDRANSSPTTTTSRLPMNAFQVGVGDDC